VSRNLSGQNAPTGILGSLTAESDDAVAHYMTQDFEITMKPLLHTLTANQLLLVVAALVVAASGCRGDGLNLQRATGTVTYQGEVAADAVVTFNYEDGQIASGVTNDTGQFEMTTASRKGAPVGKAKVLVTKISSGGMPQMPANPTPEAMFEMDPREMRATAAPKNALPARYAQLSETPLEVEISESGDNDFTLELVD
jgi:hypothetical protein